MPTGRDIWAGGGAKTVLSHPLAKMAGVYYMGGPS